MSYFKVNNQENNQNIFTQSPNKQDQFETQTQENQDKDGQALEIKQALNAKRDKFRIDIREKTNKNIFNLKREQLYQKSIQK